MTVYFSQGSVATDLKEGGSFNSIFLRRSFLNSTVKKITKTVHVCRSYRKNKIGTLFFCDTVYSMACVHQCAPCGLRPSENRPHSFRGGRRKRRRNQTGLSSVLWSVFCVFIMASLIVFGYFPCSVSWLSFVVNFGASD